MSNVGSEHPFFLKSNKRHIKELQHKHLLYLIHIHLLSVDFDWPRAGHAEGAILSCRMVVLPSDVISALKHAAARVVTCVCLHCTWRVLFCHVA